MAMLRSTDPSARHAQLTRDPKSLAEILFRAPNFFGLKEYKQSNS
jgi:hypothetical protein